MPYVKKETIRQRKAQEASNAGQAVLGGCGCYILSLLIVPAFWFTFWLYGWLYSHIIGFH